ncbi:alpha/beta hydrolase [Nocardia sp. 004]|uniref:alpha/beta hydrolase n=1 Tax=Nocardia sp. 004 TaxID=3385978 RepID=UPI0039A2A74A
MPFFDGARGRMHYRLWPIDTPSHTVVLLPGMGQHSGHYHHFARTLHSAGAQISALDPFGQGLSEGDPQRPGTLTELVDDASRLVESARAAQPRTPLVLMGHSLGAATALGLLGAAIPDTAVVGTVSVAASTDYPLHPALAAHTLSGLVLSGTPKRVLGGGMPGALGTPLPHTLPVLAIHGVEDRRAPIDAMRAWAGRHTSVDMREYPDTGHDLLHEPRSGIVARDICRWLLGLEWSERDSLPRDDLSR